MISATPQYSRRHARVVSKTRLRHEAGHPRQMRLASAGSPRRTSFPVWAAAVAVLAASPRRRFTAGVDDACDLTAVCKRSHRRDMPIRTRAFFTAATTKGGLP